MQQPPPQPASPPRIVLLPRDVAERIAAGEVIERPAAVVRELVDNAIDAGAREISIELRGGGLELIRVADDGAGIPPEQVELAFQRHATSKLRRVEDLGALRTLGFRGEALASIATVAEVTLLTRWAGGDQPGVQVVVHGGGFERRSAVARQPGTTVSVRHLFHNTPARLAFLAGAHGETQLVGQLVRHYALAHSELRLSLSVDGHASFQTPGRGTLAATLADVLGPTVARAMLPLAPGQVGEARLSGFVSGRGVTRPSRRDVSVFVNQRWASSRGLMAALEAAYRPLLPRGRHPVAVIFLDVPPAEVDVNIHPAKTEVRLLRETELAEALAEAVRAALSASPLQLDAEAQSFALAEADQLALPPRRRRVAESGGYAFERLDLAHGRVLAQLQDTLILLETNQGLLLVDQHRAHERVIHQQLTRQSDAPQPQMLLEPLVVELRPRLAELVSQRLGDLAGLGLLVERFGGHSFLLRGLPVAPTGDAAEAAASWLEDAASVDDHWQSRLLASLACRSAIRRGRPLEAAEQQQLIQQLAEVDAPAVCPHGSPLILQLTPDFLRRQFSW